MGVISDTRGSERGLHVVRRRVEVSLVTEPNDEELPYVCEAEPTSVVDFRGAVVKVLRPAVSAHVIVGPDHIETRLGDAGYGVMQSSCRTYSIRIPVTPDRT